MSGLLSKFSNLRVAHKIWGLVGFLIVANVAVAATILFQLNIIKSEIHEVSAEHMPMTEITTKITVHQLEQAIEFERGVRYAEQIKTKPTAKDDLAKVEKHFNELSGKLNKEIQSAEELAESVIEHTSDEAVKEEYTKILKGFKHYEQAHKKFESHAHEVFEGAKAGKLDAHAIEEIAHKVEKEADALDREIEGLLAEIEAFTEKSIETVEHHESNALLIGAIMVLASIALSLPLCFFIVRGIGIPLTQVVNALGTLAEGDTTTNLNITSEDEIGKTAQAYEALRKVTIEAQELAEKQKQEDAAKQRRADLLDKLTKDFDSSVQETLEAVSNSTTSLEESANTMSAAVEETNQKSTVVASSTEQATANVQTVASATEEMDNSIREISSQVQQSATIAKEAVDQAATTNESVQTLEGAAKEIGEVVQMISEIAEQTNLLALNATIEAARAGEAGKGFAVVASEVKELAGQTAKATETISQQIESIQLGTSNAVGAIGNIGSTIAKMDEIASAIAAAVEEQTATTGEIAQNVQQVSMGTQETMTAMGEVKVATEDTGRVAHEVQKAAKDLMTRSETLSDNVNSFLDNIKAA